MTDTPIVTQADIDAVSKVLGETVLGNDARAARAIARHRIASTAEAAAFITEAADLITELVDALRDAAGMIGGPDDFTGLRDNDTTEHTITVSIGAVKKFRAALAKAGGQ
jgi:hypothetical protein